MSNKLSFSLQFVKTDLDSLAQIHDYEIPEKIQAIEVELGEARMSDIEYCFRVIYTLESSSKSKSHIKFVNSPKEDAEEIRNVLIRKEPSDSLYPHRASVVAQLVQKKSGKKFSTHNHTQAWRKFNTRSRSGTAQPGSTNKDYCIYHQAHRDYTYSDKWVDFLAEFIVIDDNYRNLKNFKLRII